MRQLIARIDDELHRRLKQRATAQERSLNDLVTSILEAAVDDDAALLRERIDRSGLRVLPPTPAHGRPREEVIQQQQGVGRSVSQALAAQRDAR